MAGFRAINRPTRQNENLASKNFGCLVKVDAMLFLVRNPFTFIPFELVKHLAHPNAKSNWTTGVLADRRGANAERIYKRIL